jgi:L-lactate dehydrogenase (cytochrome)
VRLTDCHNFRDFRDFARRRIPRPIFDYIDGGADDETSKRRNAAAFDDCDLVPNVLRGVPDCPSSGFFGESGRFRTGGSGSVSDSA